MSNKAKENPSTEKILSVLSYDRETGLFYHKVSRGNKKAGSLAGSIETMEDGYKRVRISIDGVFYLASRLAAQLIGLKFGPHDIIDHADNDPTNNSANNLRIASKAQNMHNSRMVTRNKCGIKGVTFDDKTGLYRGRVMFDGRSYSVGRSKSIDEIARQLAEKREQLHGEFKNNG